MTDQTRVQRKKQPAAEQVQTALATGGQPLAADTRAALESRFGHSFADVRVHTDERAAQSAEALNARAYTAGSDIAFGAGQYAPGTPAGDHLLAHELTHVVQQRGAAGAVQPKTRDVSAPGDATEREAESVADAVMRGAAVHVAASAGGVLQRAVKTNGGEWDTTTYATFSDASAAAADGTGTRIGTDIDLKFTPNELVEADTIGLIQTVKTLRSTSAGGAVNDPSNARTMPDALTTGEGDVGRGIDQLDNALDPTTGNATTLPQTNPLYATTNVPANPASGAAAQVSGSLTDIAPDPANGWGDHGNHKRKPDGTFDTPKDATLSDKPRRQLLSGGQQWTQAFEVTALVLDGPLANTYLGSIEWGWQNDAAGAPTLNPDPIKLARAGAPTSDFMAAANKWNGLSFTDSATGTTHNTVDVPITNLDSGTLAAADRSSSDLVLRLAQVELELALLPAGTDQTNKVFEKRALEAEIGRRDAQPATTLAAEAAKAVALSTPDLLKRLQAVNADLALAPIVAVPGQGNSAIEQQALEAELKKRTIKVDVTVNSTEDWLGSDEVYVEVTGPGGLTYKTDTHDLNDGQSHSFTMLMEKLIPAGSSVSTLEPFKIEVYDEDSPDGDDLIVKMDWAAPYAAKQNTSSLDGANYNVKVQFEK